MGTIGGFLADVGDESGIPLGEAAGSVIGGFLDSAFGAGADADQFKEQFKEAIGQPQNVEYIRAVKVLRPQKEAGTESVWNAPYSIYQFRDVWGQNVDRVRQLLGPGQTEATIWQVMGYGSYDQNFGWVAPQQVLQDSNGNPLNDGKGKGPTKDLQPSFWDKMPWKRWATMETWEKALWIVGGLLTAGGLIWGAVRLFKGNSRKPSTR